MQLNKKYQRQLGLSIGMDVIPWRIRFIQSDTLPTEGTYLRPNALQMNGFRNVIMNLSHAFIAQPRFKRFYHYRLQRMVRKDIIRIAELLFAYGYGVEKIVSRQQSSPEAIYVESILNDYLLSKLEKTASRIRTVKQISYHIALITQLNLKHIIPSQEFCRITDYGKALRFAAKIEKGERKNRFYRRIVKLYHTYDRNPQCAVLKHFLNFTFSRTFYDYPSNQSGLFGGDFSKAFIFPSYFSTRAVEDKAQEEIRGYSSKGKEEMLALLKLLLRSLENPQQYRNKEIVILGDIQSGAMGKVSIGIYKDKLVALKKPASDPGSRDFARLVRFLKHECRIHEELAENDGQGHRNIVECYGLLKANNTVMLALGYFPADNLENLIEKNRKLSIHHPAGEWGGLILEEIHRVCTQMVDALRYMKRKHIIHRDLKPANVLFLADQNGCLSTTKIIDFGIAISLDPSRKTTLFDNRTVGTLNYMAPEQLISQGTYESDVYSLGAIIYALLTGRVPIRIEGIHDLREKLRLVYREERIPLLEANPGLGDNQSLLELAKIVEQMIRRNPSQRPNVEEVADQLNRIWSSISDPEAFLEPIRYTKQWGGPYEDSLVRTTTQTLEMDDVGA